jgi:uncharacterized alkaline shock family protein YloU
MKKNKNLGIYIDHSRAVLMEMSGNVIGENHILSEFSTEGKGSNLKQIENSEHDIDLRLHSKYFKDISHAIQEYQDVIFFGPTDVQVEILNYLNQEKLTKNIKIETRKTDRMDGTQMRSYVKSHYKVTPVPVEENE